MPKRTEYCQRCSKKFDFEDREYCWYCCGILCSDCWENYGHCGHKDAESIDEQEARHILLEIDGPGKTTNEKG